MNTKQFDVVGIGNAIVDILVKTEDAFLEDHNLSKGTMSIIDSKTAEGLSAQIDSGIEVSGGSAANTISILAALGGTGAFIGSVSNDQLGATFRRDIRSMGVSFETPSKASDSPTARCFVFVTPDAERTMQTFLGACAELEPNDIQPDLITSAEITYLEGYLWDPPLAKKAFEKAAKIAKNAERTVALSLSDPFCVHRHREELIVFINNYVDILFSNEEEVKALYLAQTFEEAIKSIPRHCNVAALTRGENGSVIVAGDEKIVISGELVETVVDTTGAGDAYAAGFLKGLTGGNDLKTCGLIGGIAAAETISRYGARPKENLDKLVKVKLAP